jgi:prepilin peptidase CpaA
MIDPESAGVWGWLGLATSVGVMATLVVGDLRDGKIPNKLTYPAAAAGLVLHLGASISDPDAAWWLGLRDSSAGFALGFFIMFLGFMFGGIGGGDVKACAALGALVGIGTTVYGLLYMGLVGGAMALSIMIWKGKLFRSMRNMARFFFTALIPGLTTEMPKEENSDPFPLGVAIAIGFAWAMVEEGWLHAQPIIDLGI